MPDLVVYRSNHPDVLAHWEAVAKARTEWRDKVVAAFSELGFTGRNFATRGGAVIGIEHPEDAEIPEGWRRCRELPTAIVPDRRTATGKKLAKQLASLTRPDPRNNIPGGMPTYGFSSGMGFMKPGMALRDGAVYVTWSNELADPDAGVIDAAVWQRLKLSAYYAAVEAYEEAKTDA